MLELEITGLKKLNQEVEAILELEDEGYFDESEKTELINKSAKCLSMTLKRV